MDYEELERELIHLRRDFHAYPESAWLEFRTCSLISRRLEALGYNVKSGLEVIDTASVMGRPSEEVIARNIQRALSQGADPGQLTRLQGYTGLTAELDTGRPGPVVALRFDMDCVEVQEDTSSSHRPEREGFSSVNTGLCHSCGHDAHVSIGLGVAEALMSERERLRGKVRLIFQPGEEGCRGAYAMMMKGVVDDADYFMAMHIGMGVPSGVFVLNAAGWLATAKIDAEFSGVPAHASASPEKGRNALLAACTATLGLHSIAPHSGGNMRINVGTLNAGTGRNVIADHAAMRIETRGETQEVAEYAYSRAVEVLKGSAMMYGVDVDISKAGEGTTSEGSPELVRVAGEAVRELGIFGRVEESSHAGASEDATWFMRRVQSHGGQAVYFGLGSDITAPHHNGRFDVDEAVMIDGVRALAAITERLMS
ncbi:MAG: amidohydrolase [Synergistaceae bacterium]|nr:amidohydrolase [Synergistaceae bacterium]